MRALFDTSVFIAIETGRIAQTPPEVDAAQVSVLTVGELTAGALNATSEQLPARVATLARVESSWDPLPVDLDVARRFGAVVADLRRRGRKVPVIDALIAATALAHDIPLVTQDRDYDAIEGLQVIRI